MGGTKALGGGAGGDPRGVHYSASKAGVIGLTRAMALALALAPA